MSGPRRRAPYSPDCRVGKHTACSGDAWDDIDDEMCGCGCPCHFEAL